MARYLVLKPLATRPPECEYNLEIPVRKNLAQANFRASTRIAILLATAAILCATEMIPSRSPRFSDYPFDQWASAPEHAAIKWDVRLLPAELSIHQRLLERIQTVVPGGELARRRGRGELVLLTRFEDSDGRQWRTGSRLNLVNVQAGVKSEELTFTTAAFVKPGNYKVLIALLDTQTMDHSFTRRTLHVAGLKSDPLPDAWLGLPPVEILPVADGPDTWFLPTVKGLLHLPLQAGPDAHVKTAALAEPGTGVRAQTAMFMEKGAASAGHQMTANQEAPRIDLLVNTTPSEWSPSPASALRRNMSAVIPALKVLSALNANVRPPSAAVIDLTHQRVGFETPDATALDWTALNKVLSATNPGVIDAKSLSAQASMREYFIHEVEKRALSSDSERWLVVMSGPLVFAHQDDTPPPALPVDPRRHLVYLRFSGFASGLPGLPPGPVPDIQIGPVRRVHGPMPGLGAVLPPGAGRGRGRGEPLAIYPDDLERVLKPMGAQIVSITSPEIFRKTVASLIEQISAAD